jgi:SAM-dependent methyltransferase
VREALAPILRCPVCHKEGDWSLDADTRDEREIREGALRCGGCGAARPVEHGIVDMLADPPEFVAREAAGLGRFADTMRADGWDREKILSLPNVDLGYWYGQAVGMEQVLRSPETAPLLRPGARILDVGSNTCWASAKLAEQGLDVVALDIATHEMQGLRTADWWMEDRGVYFERVLGIMFDLPFASASLDLIFCCEVLHHNHAANLRATFKEFARVLKPGGTVIVINEPLRTVLRPNLHPGSEVAEYEGHEHVYTRSSYTRAARGAGLDVEVIGPWTVGMFQGAPWPITPETSTLTALRTAAAHAVRRNRALRRAFLAFKSLVVGEVSLYMTATKRA